MTTKTSLKPLSFALGAAFVTTLAATAPASAAENPFAMTEIAGGYMVAESAEGKCGEGKCGGSKEEAKADAKTGAEGKCGGSKDEAKAGVEGKCGGSK